MRKGPEAPTYTKWKLCGVCVAVRVGARVSSSTSGQVREGLWPETRGCNCDRRGSPRLPRQEDVRKGKRRRGLFWSRPSWVRTHVGEKRLLMQVLRLWGRFVRFPTSSVLSVQFCSHLHKAMYLRRPKPGEMRGVGLGAGRVSRPPPRRVGCVIGGNRGGWDLTKASTGVQAVHRRHSLARDLVSPSRSYEYARIPTISPPGVMDGQVPPPKWASVALSWQSQSRIPASSSIRPP